MKEILLVIVIVVVFGGGYFVMDGIDRFLEKSRRARRGVLEIGISYSPARQYIRKIRAYISRGYVLANVKEAQSRRSQNRRGSVPRSCFSHAFTATGKNP